MSDEANGIVLILGAGASVPYGFPTGPDLFDTVCRELGKESSKSLELMKAVYGNEGEVRKFRDELFYSGEDTIDSFLENRGEQKFNDLAKFAMTIELVQHEHEDTLFLAEKEDPNKNKGKWYKFLKQLIAPSKEAFKTSNVTILTYNYDRSLDHFLYKSVMTSFGLKPKECTDLFRKDRIIHLHGQLGNLPWENPGTGRDYHPEISADEIVDAADKITLPFDVGIESGVRFKLGLSKIQKARQVYFLGFGYGHNNMQRIRGTVQQRGVAKGTAYGLSNAERTRAGSYFQIELADREVDTLGFLESLERI